MIPRFHPMSILSQIACGNFRRKRRTAAAAPSMPVPDAISHHPDLETEIERLISTNDVRSMTVLYDAYADMARAVQAVKNQPRATQAGSFLRLEFEAAMSRAEIVVYRLHQMPIESNHSGEAGRVIVDCAIRTGMNLDEALAVVSSTCAARDEGPAQ